MKHEIGHELSADELKPVSTVVPIEPTDSMINAGLHATDGWGSGLSVAEMRRRYRAMVEQYMKDQSDGG